METDTYDEYADMLLIYGECLENAREAAQEYAIPYSHRQHLFRHIFSVADQGAVKSVSCAPSPSDETVRPG